MNATHRSFAPVTLLLAALVLVACSNDESAGRVVTPQDTGGTSGTSGAAGSNDGGASGAGASNGGTGGGSGSSSGNAGTSGANGTAGSSGASGTSGMSGATGANGSAGASGNSGTSGASGSSGSPASVAITAPADGATVTNPVTIGLSATNVDTIGLVADDMFSIPVTWDPTSSSTHSFSYTFSTLGLRKLTLSGFVGGSSTAAATDEIHVTIEDTSSSLCDAAQGTDFIPPTTCDGASGHTSSEKPSNAMYATSWFGCYEKTDGTIYKDPDDNCEFACGNQGLCDSSLSGPQCEAQLKWFSADSTRYGCGARIKLTNCANGKQVVLAALDAGPNCPNEQEYDAPVIDMSHDAMIYLFDGHTYGGSDHKPVVVEKVDSATPLGPVE